MGDDLWKGPRRGGGAQVPTGTPSCGATYLEPLPRLTLVTWRGSKRSVDSPQDTGSWRKLVAPAANYILDADTSHYVK